ncbi:MAG: hypothetical protein ABI197_08970 [Granulicella sp.]
MGGASQFIPSIALLGSRLQSREDAGRKSIAGWRRICTLRYEVGACIANEEIRGDEKEEDGRAKGNDDEKKIGAFKGIIMFMF